MRRNLCLLALSLCVSSTPGLAQSSPPAEIVLHGQVHPDQNQTYIEAPFTVPPGTHRISVAFHNLGRDQHTVLDLGMADPDGFRGASGGNKDHFTISETDATPSYLPGAIPAGEWKLLIAVPNIRPRVTTSWRAEVWFNRVHDDTSFADVPVREQAGWYRGDLHMHTAHSDGSCLSQSGKPVPCPAFLTLEAAVRRGLDFIAITDHNTTSHYDDERELQAYFDTLLLIPGRELTTFYGHANAFGTMRFIDYRVGTAKMPDTNTLLRGAKSAGAIISINHPEAPTGEVCMGCGWTPQQAVDTSLVTSVEVINGGGAPATHFWEDQLRQGHRLTAIGGSDNHHADWPLDKPGSVGYPTTVVHAHSLSVEDILDGVRSGQVFIDATGSRTRFLDLHAQLGSESADMGGDLEPKAGQTIALQLHISGCVGATVDYFVDGKAVPSLPSSLISSADQQLRTTWQSDGARHWVRAEVHDHDGRLLLFGNPVYLGFESSPKH